jgi:putative flippase GtrA
LIVSYYKSNTRLIRFACVGCIGFCIDALCLTLIALFIPFPIARACSFWISATSNWWLNRYFTFSDKNGLHSNSDQTKGRQWLSFLAVSCIGFIPNWICYTLLLQHTIWAVKMPVIAIVPGILIAMFLNYSLSKRWVFKLK